MTRVRGRIGFLGPEGSFSHEALQSLGDREAIAFSTIGEVLAAVADGRVDQGLVPLENAIEGTVSASIDGLVFDHDLTIVRELVLPIHLHLMTRPGVSLEQVTRVASYTHALGQVRHFLTQLPHARIEPTASTSQAAAETAGSTESWAAVGSRLAARLFGLSILAEDIEDHPGNATRFVLVARETVPPPTGHDRTLVVCFQDADRPGSLYGILGRFAARDINLTKLESRPTKTGLGDYCFVIEFDGHISDEIVADCLVDVQAHLVRVKFLGSYPVTGEGSGERRGDVDIRRSRAREWMNGLLARIEPA
jgi:prephenate dehydratase